MGNSYPVDDFGLFLCELTRCSWESYMEGALEREIGVLACVIVGLCQWKRQLTCKLILS